MSLNEQPLDAVSVAMEEPSFNDPEVQLEYSVARIIRELGELPIDERLEVAMSVLDDLMVLAAKDDTAHLVMANRIFVGQILVRSNTLARLLMARQPQPFRVNHAA